uniref:Uncharacterized protein n=1 Tax=Seriola lalandi dorsalis TaxID=1841481 RepID=A0A3B4WVA8_SERLL
MSLFNKMFSGGEKVTKKPSEEEEVEKLLQGEALLMEKKEHLKKKIDRELLYAKKNSRKNRRGEVSLKEVDIHHCVCNSLVNIPAARSGSVRWLPS